MRHGEKDVLWSGQVRWYAKSSGTTNDKSKFIPVSKECLQDTHYRGGTDAVALYLGQNPRSRMFDGKALILGGSHAPNYNLPHSLVGDLSAILIENASPFVNYFRIPSKKVALLGDFEEKRERIAQAAIREKRDEPERSSVVDVVRIDSCHGHFRQNPPGRRMAGHRGLLPRRRSLYPLPRTIPATRHCIRHALHGNVQCQRRVLRATKRFARPVHAPDDRLRSVL